nr:mitogen-activated protein kinase kinase kinase NPK1-like [Ipomoea batatas]
MTAWEKQRFLGSGSYGQVHLAVLKLVGEMKMTVKSAAIQCSCSLQREGAFFWRRSPERSCLPRKVPRLEAAQALRLRASQVFRRDECLRRFPSRDDTVRGAGRSYTAAKDIWAVGCMFVEMVTGKPMWEVDNEDELGMKIPKHFSPSAKSFLKMCLDREPGRRWTAEKLLSHPFLERLGVVFESKKEEEGFVNPLGALRWSSSRDLFRVLPLLQKCLHLSPIPHGLNCHQASVDDAARQETRRRRDDVALQQHSSR